MTKFYYSLLLISIACSRLLAKTPPEEFTNACKIAGGSENYGEFKASFADSFTAEVSSYKKTWKEFCKKQDLEKFEIIRTKP